MSTSTPDIPVGFRVIDQQHAELPDDQGNLSGIWTVTFETPSGIKDFVKLPDSQYSPENVLQAISDRVIMIETVQRLGSGVQE